jgi:hypothetical protein
VVLEVVITVDSLVSGGVRVTVVLEMDEVVVDVK